MSVKQSASFSSPCNFPEAPEYGLSSELQQYRLAP